MTVHVWLFSTHDGSSLRWTEGVELRPNTVRIRVYESGRLINRPLWRDLALLGLFILILLTARFGQDFNDEFIFNDLKSLTMIMNYYYEQNVR